MVLSIANARALLSRVIPARLAAWAVSFAPLVPAAWLASFAPFASASCQAVDPGPNFVVAEEHFNEDYFYCHVEPALVFAKKCGSGESGDGGNCHFNASAVRGMVLVNHEPIDCAGGDHPVDRTRVGAGSAAQGNLQSVSFQMSRDIATAPLLVRPTGADHPRVVFPANDPVVDVLRAWAQQP